MDASENFYLLLDLDPDRHTSWADIEPLLKAKRGEWSAQTNHPKHGLEAKRCLGLVRRIESELKDDAKRKAHADAARGLLRDRRTRSLAALDKLVELFKAQNYLTTDDVDRLTAQGIHGANRWTAADVQARVAAAKLPVRAALLTPDDPQLIEAAVFDTIRDNLTVVGKADLYDFLAAARSAATPQLRRLADAEDGATRLESVRDAKVTARMALVGFCLNLFGADDLRRKYDATLQWHELEDIRTSAEIAGRGEKRVSAAVVELLVSRGAKTGITRERVVAAVQEVAQKNNWLVEVMKPVPPPPPPPPPPRTPRPPPTANNPVEIQPCPKCGTRLSVLPGDVGLDIECPNCQTIWPARRLDAPPPPDDDRPRKSRFKQRRVDDDDDEPRGRARRVKDEDDEPQRRRRRQPDARDGSGTKKWNACGFISLGGGLGACICLYAGCVASGLRIVGGVLAFVGLIFGLIGLVVAKVSGRRVGSGIATAGTTVSSCALLMSVLVIAVAAMTPTTPASSFSTAPADVATVQPMTLEEVVDYTVEARSFSEEFQTDLTAAEVKYKGKDHQDIRDDIERSGVGTPPGGRDWWGVELVSEGAPWIVRSQARGAHPSAR